MPDVGWGELLLLAVVALVIFGPDKLPKAAADAGRMVRKLRELANSAQKDIAPGMDLDGIKSDLRSVADLHPKRIISNAISDATSSTPAKPAPTVPTPPPPVTGAAAAAAAEAPSAPAPKPALDPRLDPDAT